MNFLIGIIIVVGFFIFWGRSAGWVKEGGFVYEWWRKKYPKKITIRNNGMQLEKKEQKDKCKE